MDSRRALFMGAVLLPLGYGSEKGSDIAENA
jgi:hypothetical protein